MSTAKIRTAAKRWAFKWAVPVEQLSPEQVNFRIQLAYMDGVERGRRDQRASSRRPKGSRGNTKPLSLPRSQHVAAHDCACEDCRD
jgi:hypothetical protein